MTDEPEGRFFAQLVSLADTLVRGFDVMDLADQLAGSCLEYLPVASAGIMLDDQRGNLRVLASSSEEARLLELLELQNNEGPCLEAFSSGEVVVDLDLASGSGRWPSFSEEAGQQGILAAYALPLQLRDRTIGALNLFCASRQGLTEEELRVAHVMTNMATLGILNHWTARRQEVVAEQLQTALNSRIVIEQARGVIAERSGVDMATAFEMLRSNARSERRSLSTVAEGVVQHRVPPTELPEVRRSSGPGPASAPPADPS